MTLAFDPTQPAPDETPSFPPLLTGVPVKPGVDPFAKAVAEAGAGRAQIGDFYWSPDADVLRAAVLFVPDEPLEKALPVIFAAACGLNDCIGALAPPETGLLHVWPDGIKINGGWCGAFRADAATRDPSVVPEWLVVGLSLSLAWPEDGPTPGEAPYLTALSEEGCGHLSAVRLLESWARHLLVWVNRWEDEGDRPITDAWLARAEGWKDEVAFTHGETLHRGMFLGLDDTGGMVLKRYEDSGEVTVALPLLSILDAPRPWPPEKLP